MIEVLFPRGFPNVLCEPKVCWFGLWFEKFWARWFRFVDGTVRR
jgi:hypothetical protein